MTAGDLMEYEMEDEVDVRSMGATTDRIEVAEMTRRRVSWKVESRRGQAVMRLLESILASPFSTVVIASTSERISSSK